MAYDDNPLAGGNVKSIPPLATAIQQLAREQGGLAPLAHRLGINVKNVRRYAEGVQQPDIDTRRELAKLCNDHRTLSFWNAVSRGEQPHDLGV